MATLTQTPSPLIPCALLFFLLMNSCFCFNPKLLNVSLKVQPNANWSLAGATWYGNPNGAGSDGGACGYGNIVGKAPFSSLIAAGGPSLFKTGKGCGACYQVKCSQNKICSGNAVRVVISDECAGCVRESVHFDLSGTAIGDMAISGMADQLRNLGVLQIQYRRVPCNYGGKSVGFHVDSGSNPYYFSCVIEYINGDGNLAGVELKEASGSRTWQPMQHSWGAVWKLNTGSILQPPFSIRLISEFGETLVANNVIPTGWKAGMTYTSLVNFLV